jgi:hypothetical protein
MFQAIPLNGETWLICGGRDFADIHMFDDVMISLTTSRGCPSKIVHGGARGADTMAAQWARRMALDETAVPADWNTHGKGAGPIRNQKMLDDHCPKFVVAFPGGRGTADMIARAREAGIDVAEIKAQ